MTRDDLVQAVRLSIGMLTAVPVPAPARVDRTVAGLSMLVAPLAGLAPAALAAAVGWALTAAGAPPLAAGGLTVAAAALATRGLHLDGLADTADALTASYRRERALEVMRKGNTGPAGAAALVLVLLTQAGAVAQLLGRGVGGAATVLLALALARVCLPLACTRGVPAARPEGLGAMVAGSVPRTATAVAVALAAALAAVVGLPGTSAVQRVAALLAALAVTGALLRRATTRLGGVTGDILGASVELSSLTLLVFLAS